MVGLGKMWQLFGEKTDEIIEELNEVLSSIIKIMENNTEEIERIKAELAKTLHSKRQRIFMMIMGAALGTIPWVGGFMSALTSFKSSESQIKNNELYEQWFLEHEKKIKDLNQTLQTILKRLNSFPDNIDARLESEGYLNIVRKGFRIRDSSDTDEKREIIRKLITNAGAYEMVDDDLIRLFLDWINLYHEVHFAIIKAIQTNNGATRFEIWQNINGKDVREDSLEADLFKTLMRDLTLGGVIRQYRAVDYGGNFIKKTPSKKSSNTSSTMKSAFDNGETYELTELGQSFVHYTMNELVSRVEQHD